MALPEIPRRPPVLPMIPVHAAGATRLGFFWPSGRRDHMNPIFRAVALQDVADPQALWDTALEGEFFHDEAATHEGPSTLQDE